METTESALLGIGTVLLLYATWAISLKAGRLHGLFRFVSFECILILLLRNWRLWFVDPLMPRQIISWVLLFGSIIPAWLGYRTLKTRGRSGDQFEDTHQLVRTGIYSFIRHPMYLSLMLLGSGISLKNPDLTSIILGAVNCLALVATALREEREMVAKFGEEYRSYISQTWRFAPHIF